MSTPFQDALLAHHAAAQHYLESVRLAPDLAEGAAKSLALAGDRLESELRQMMREESRPPEGMRGR